MKIIIISFFVFVLTYPISAQKLNDSDVPQAVKTAFTAMYPDVKHIKWSLEDKKYEAEFKQNGVESSVLFEPNGTYYQTETEIPISMLPEDVKDYISKNLAGKKIKEAAKITDAKGTITYEAEAGGSDYLFDANGTFISKSTETDQDDDKD